MNRDLHQLGAYEVGDRVSNIIWPANRAGSRIFASDWSGNLHFLRYYPGTRMSKLTDFRKISDYGILSMDEDRSTDGSNKLLLGNGIGELISYDVEAQIAQSIKNQNTSPLAKVISVQEDKRVFTFSWNRTLQIWDLRDKKVCFTHKLGENFITAEYVHPYIVLITAANTIAFINVDHYANGSTIKMRPIGYKEPIKSLAFNKSLEYMALGDVRGNVKVLKSTRDINYFEAKEKLVDKGYTILFECKTHYLKNLGPEKEIEDVLFPTNAVSFENEKSLYSAGGDRHIYAIDVDAERGDRKDGYIESETIMPFKRPFTHLKFNGDRTAFITCETENKYHDLFNDEYSGPPKSIVRVFSLKNNEIY